MLQTKSIIIQYFLQYEYFKTVTKETGDNRNVLPTENATNLMDCKEMK